MKTKAIIFSGVIIFILAIISSCLKKGEDDPFISLRTRNNRLIGEWQLMKMESETIRNDIKTNGEEYNDKTTENFDANSLIVVEEHSGINTASFSSKQTYTYNYSQTLSINKDGIAVCTASKTQTSPTTAPAEVTTISNYWHWQDSKKGRIYLEAGCAEGEIIRLSNKELIIEYVYSFEESNGNWGNNLEFKLFIKERLEFNKK